MTPLAMITVNQQISARLFVLGGELAKSVSRLGNRRLRAEMREVGRGKDHMVEECERCAGRGCKQCGWVGQISRRI